MCKIINTTILFVPVVSYFSIQWLRFLVVEGALTSKL